MLKDEIVKYVEDWPDAGDSNPVHLYNCAEALLNACNDYYDLELDVDTFKAISSFGGGFYCGKTCGLMAGGLAAIGVMYAKGKPFANDKVKEMDREWNDMFEKEFSSTDCAVIKKESPVPCKDIVQKAAELFEELNR